ncbi:hypothetical protein ACHAXA_002264 [Cyclostephanos tholiformis]|uniref:Uncharacterized protein n=1 Tax=Cyclostephanos tholiformis TaxID=382380 RepID=A0ABD3RSK9_9STRA
MMSMDYCDAPPPAGHSRRRRRKKNHPTETERPRNAARGSSTDLVSRQDAELEREVDAYFLSYWGPDIGKGQRRVHYGEYEYPTSRKLVDTNEDKMPTRKAGGGDISRSLPVLLHLREVGYKRRRSRNNISYVNESSASSSQWNSRILKTDVGGDDDDNDDDKDDDDGYSTTAATATSIKGISRARSQAWRPYGRRMIPFSKLRTPLLDAILAIDRWGGFLIGVGSGDDDSRCPYLSIKFYGVPSPARLRQIENHELVDKTPQIASPLLQTVPLLHGKCFMKDRIIAPSFVNHSEHASPAAELPVQILMSESVGVAFIQHITSGWTHSSPLNFSGSPAMQDEDILGTIVVFDTPRRGAVDFDRSTMTKSLRLNNVRIGGGKSFTIRNALWPTTAIPTGTKDFTMKVLKEDSVDSTFAPYLCDYFRRALSAYMLFNDEDDGFRITWITTAESVGDNEEVCANEASNSIFRNVPNPIRPRRNDIVAPTEGSWQECLTDTLTGYRAIDERDVAKHSEGLNVEFEAYLSVDALLNDIICRRRQSSLFKKSPYHNEKVFFMPEHSYNLISASPDALKVILVVTFSNKEKMIHSSKKVPSALGVFVEVNLFDQSYSEIQWVQHPSCSDASSLQRWSGSLALNWRMKQCRVGVFCLDTSEIGPHLANWSCKTHEHNVDEDLSDDCSVKIWGNYVKRRFISKENVAPPKDISMSSLYPYCDLVTNQAVYKAIPVKRIISRRSPIELTYG